MADSPRVPKWRLLTVLDQQNELVPYNWREGVQSWIYSALRGTMVGNRIHNSRFSLFTYYLEPEIPVFEIDGMRSKTGRWYFRFASALPEALVVVMSSLMDDHRVDFGFGVFDLVAMYKEPLTTRAEFRTAPVLAAKLKERGFWTPKDPEFKTAIIKSLENRWKFFTGDELPNISIKISKVRRQKLIQYKDRSFLCFPCDIRIDAPLRIRQFAQCVGLGQKPSCGFGYLF